MASKPVAIIMGSQSDWATMKHAARMLAALKVGHVARIVSAHRTPKRLYEFAGSARRNGFKVIIAGAGGVVTAWDGGPVATSRSSSRASTSIVSPIASPSHHVRHSTNLIHIIDAVLQTNYRGVRPNEWSHLSRGR